MKYFVIAEKELVLGFSLVGVRGSVATNRNEALEAFNKIIAAKDDDSDEFGNVKILILSAGLSIFIEDEIVEWQKRGVPPLIVEVPPLHDAKSSKASISDVIRGALGIRI